MEIIKKFNGLEDFLAYAEYAQIFVIGKSFYKFLGYIQCEGFYVVNAFKICSDGRFKLVALNTVDYQDKCVTRIR